jgi:N-acetyl-anhydromuramyl-L-alanine amidase AmpD
MNKKGDDACFFKLLSFGNARQETLAKRLLAGTATKAEALEYLDANYKSSQVFIKDELKVRTIQKNYSTGHRSSKPMKGMILHYTANQKEDGTIRYFLGSSAHASTHFVIGSVRNGLLVQLFSHKHRTWHAGSYNQDRFGIDFANAGYLKKSGSSWVDYAKRKYTVDLPLHGNNPIKVTGGIPGAHSKYGRLSYWQPYTYYQLLSFLVVGRALHLVYALDVKLCQRHGDVSSSRVDPGPALPTTALLKLVFSKDDVLSVQWLRDYKVQKDWIAKNPNAR